MSKGLHLDDRDRPETRAEDLYETTPAGTSNEWVEIDTLGLGAENIGGMVVQSAAMRRVLKTIARLGPYKATVLIHGESGTGKELVEIGRAHV